MSLHTELWFTCHYMQSCGLHVTTYRAMICMSLHTELWFACHYIQSYDLLLIPQFYCSGRHFTLGWDIWENSVDGLGGHLITPQQQLHSITLYVHFDMTVVFALLCSVVREATWITGGHSITKVRLMDLENEVRTTNNPSWEPTIYY